MQWLVDNPRAERVASAAIAALGRGASLHRGLVTTGIEIRFVFARDLAAYLAAASPADRERTILVNADRGDVIELLEANQLGGAIECEEHDSWTSHEARMFVRRDAIDLARGTVIGGPNRESDHYVLWTSPDPNTRTCKLADLVRLYTDSLARHARRNDELVISADEARTHDLPAVGMRMVVGNVGMSPSLFPKVGWYLQFISPPGGPKVFDVRVCQETALDAVVRESFGTGDDTLVHTGSAEVPFAGATRTAALCESGGDNDFMRMTWCLVPIAHRNGRLVVRLGTSLRVGDAPSWERVMSDRDLATLANSFTLLEV